MANITVGTSAVQIAYDPERILVIQNLGTGNVYIDHDPSVTTSTGFKLAADAVYEYPRQLNLGEGAVWIIGDAADTDVRLLEV